MLLIGESDILHSPYVESIVRVSAIPNVIARAVFRIDHPSCTVWMPLFQLSELFQKRCAVYRIIFEFSDGIVTFFLRGISIENLPVGIPQPDTADEMIGTVAIKAVHAICKPVAIFAVFTLKTLLAIRTFVAELHLEARE